MPESPQATYDAEGVQLYRDRCPLCGAESPPFSGPNDEHLAKWLVNNGWWIYKGIWLCEKCYAKANLKQPKQAEEKAEMEQAALW